MRRRRRASCGLSERFPRETLPTPWPRLSCLVDDVTCNACSAALAQCSQSSCEARSRGQTRCPWLMREAESIWPICFAGVMHPWSQRRYGSTWLAQLQQRVEAALLAPEQRRSLPALGRQPRRRERLGGARILDSRRIEDRNAPLQREGRRRQRRGKSAQAGGRQRRLGVAPLPQRRRCDGNLAALVLRETRHALDLALQRYRPRLRRSCRMLGGCSPVELWLTVPPRFEFDLPLQSRGASRDDVAPASVHRHANSI